MLRPLNSRSQTVLVSWGQGTWDTGSLFHLLSCKRHLWSSRCSVQCSGHFLHQRPPWLPPEAAIWKSPKGQQQVRGGGVEGTQGPAVWGKQRSGTWQFPLGPAGTEGCWGQQALSGLWGEARLPGPVGVALSFSLPEKGHSLPRISRGPQTASFCSRFSPFRILSPSPLSLSNSLPPLLLSSLPPSFSYSILLFFLFG